MRAPDTQTDSPRGLALAIATYLIWGFLPLYMREMAHIPPFEIIAHRILWSLPIALAVVASRGGLDKVVQTLRQPAPVRMAALKDSSFVVRKIADVRRVLATMGQLLGVPPEERGRLRPWSAAIDIAISPR